MDNSTPPTKPTKPTPLTDAQMEQIEVSNKLLATFSEYMENMKKANPAVELPAQLMFASFTLGAASAARANESISMQVGKEINEMRMLMYTYSEALASQRES